MPRQGILPLLDPQPPLWVDWDKVRWAICYPEPQADEFDPFAEGSRHVQRGLFGGKFTSVPISRPEGGDGAEVASAQGPVRYRDLTDDRGRCCA